MIQALALSLLSCSSDSNSEPEKKYETPEESACKMFGLNYDDYDYFNIDVSDLYHPLASFSCLNKTNNTLFFGLFLNDYPNSVNFKNLDIIFKDNQIRLNAEEEVQYYENKYKCKFIRCEYPSYLEEDGHYFCKIYAWYSFYAENSEINRFIPICYFYDGKNIRVAKQEAITERPVYSYKKKPEILNNSYFVTYSNIIHFEADHWGIHIKRYDLEKQEYVWSVGYEASKDFNNLEGRLTCDVEKGSTKWKVTLKKVSVNGETATEAFYLNPEDGTCSK